MDRRKLTEQKKHSPQVQNKSRNSTEFKKSLEVLYLTSRSIEQSLAKMANILKICETKLIKIIKQI